MLMLIFLLMCYQVNDWFFIASEGRREFCSNSAQFHLSDSTSSQLATLTHFILSFKSDPGCHWSVISNPPQRFQHPAKKKENN